MNVVLISFGYVSLISNIVETVVKIHLNIKFLEHFKISNKNSNFAIL